MTNAAPRPPAKPSREYPLPWWRTMRVPLLFGPLRGRLWLPFSRGKVLRLFFGTYEADQTAMISNYLHPGSVFFDVGAAVGYYTVLAAPLVGPTGRVVSFEPDPQNAAYLKKHVAINRFRNVDVRQQAVGNRNGVAPFTCGSGTGTGHLVESGSTQVAICRIDDVAGETGNPTHIKIDVEGAELEVLEGARKTLLASRPKLFLSTHGTEVQNACARYLTELGYEIRPISPNPKYESELLCLPGKRLHSAENKVPSRAA